jgi:hypothetical protein
VPPKILRINRSLIPGDPQEIQCIEDVLYVGLTDPPDVQIIDAEQNGCPVSAREAGRQYKG